MKNILLIATLLLTQQVMSQDFSIQKVEVSGDLVKVYYDLKDTDLSRTYTISLFASKDNFISPLDKVTGDIGLEIKPGGNKVITWNAMSELGNDFDGEIALEVRGRIYIPFVRLDGLQKTIKRGKTNELTWTGGTQQNILNFDLYKGEEKITSFPNIANVGHYTMTLPTSVKTGKGYRFKITDSKNKDQIVYSKEFTVKPKVPLLLKLAPIALVGAAVYFLLPDDKPDPSIKEPVLPDEIN
ncbi:MAG TPA: Ser-Thr-rich GPI-anchored membrane family protein [Cyclobacteriaceae bacterium]